VKHEIEMKFPVADLSAVRSSVVRAGGEYAGTVLQTDCYFDTPELMLLGQDRGLRLRTSERLGGRGGSPGKRPADAAMVTYKGPRKAQGRAKNRVEIQTTVGDARAVEDMLDQLGLTRRLVVQKRRSTYRLCRCLVELDELPILGAFVEIEGPGPGAIEAVARKLGLKGEPTKAHYVQLVSEACRHVNGRCLEVTFARCGEGRGKCGRLAGSRRV
jgi:adenylate cyclase, class 2